MKFIFLFIVLSLLLPSAFAKTYTFGNIEIDINNGYCYNSCSDQLSKLPTSTRLLFFDQIKNENPERFKLLINSLLRNEAYRGEGGDFLKMKDILQAVYGQEIVDKDLVNLFKAKIIEKQIKHSDDRESTRSLISQALKSPEVAQYLNYNNVISDLYHSNNPEDRYLIKQIFKSLVNSDASIASEYLMEAYWEIDVSPFITDIDPLALEKVYCAVLDTKYEQLGEYWLEECFGQSQCREYISLEFKEWEDIFSPSGVVSCNGETAQQYANDFFDHHFDPSYFDEEDNNQTYQVDTVSNSTNKCQTSSDEPYKFLVKGTELHFKVLLNAVNCDDSMTKKRLADFFYRYGVKAMSAIKKAEVQYSYMKGVKSECHFYLEAMSTKDTKFSNMHPISIEAAYDSLITILKNEKKSN